MPLVAVYGTLRVGELNHERWLGVRTPVFRGVVEIPFEMFACDEYPMLVPSGDSHAIALEVFDVNGEIVSRLDELESPYGYRRETTRLPSLDGDVEIYVHPGPVPKGFRPVASGDWTAWKESAD